MGVVWTVGADGDCLDIFLSSVICLSFSVGAGADYLDFFLSSIISLFFLPWMVGWCDGAG